MTLKKILSLFVVGFLLSPLVSASALASEDNSRILILGDSLSAGYGIDLEEGWVSLLQAKLDAEQLENGMQYKVINASISGNTTSMGIGRLPQLLKTHTPDIVVIALGGNDGLQGHPLKVMRKNLSRMIELSQASDAKVLLSGIQIPPNYGKRYTDDFFSSFDKIATQYNIELVPFMLEEIAIYPALMQSDGVHPTAEAQPQLLENMWPHLKKLL